jgi:endonuclease-8
VPEGDTIFQTAAALRPLLVGQQILGARARTPGPAIDRVIGSRVLAIDPLGKHMVIRFDNGLALHTHLRMAGTWHRYTRGEPWRIPEWRARVVLEVADHVVVCFNAPVVELMPDRAIELHPAMRSLGPDLLKPEFDAGEAFRRLRDRPNLEIAEALLDQRALAGIGNVYKSEVLFIERVNPWIAVANVDDQRLLALVTTAQRLLLENVAGGAPHRVTTRGDRVTVHGASLWVYGRLNRPCLHCGTLIRVRRQGALNRSTYWCPACQPASNASVQATDASR